MALTSRRGALRRRRIVDAATGSVGDTIAPRTNAACHDMPGTTACATQATAPMVASTSATELMVSERRSARKSLKLLKNADLYSSGGRNSTSTTSGSSSTGGIPGIKPNSAPPMTSTIGYGTDNRDASTLKPITATSNAAINTSACSIASILSGRIPPRELRLRVGGGKLAGRLDGLLGRHAHPVTAPQADV